MIDKYGKHIITVKNRRKTNLPHRPGHSILHTRCSEQARNIPHKLFNRSIPQYKQEKNVNWMHGCKPETWKCLFYVHNYPNSSHLRQDPRTLRTLPGTAKRIHHRTPRCPPTTGKHRRSVDHFDVDRKHSHCWSSSPRWRQRHTYAHIHTPNLTSASSSLLSHSELSEAAARRAPRLTTSPSRALWVGTGTGMGMGAQS